MRYGRGGEYKPMSVAQGENVEVPPTCGSTHTHTRWIPHSELVPSAPRRFVYVEEKKKTHIPQIHRVFSSVKIGRDIKLLYSVAHNTDPALRPQDLVGDSTVPGVGAEQERERPRGVPQESVDETGYPKHKFASATLNRPLNKV